MTVKLRELFVVDMNSDMESFSLIEPLGLAWQCFKVDTIKSALSCQKPLQRSANWCCMSWGRRYAQEGLFSYGETMHNIHGSGKRRAPTEFSEIGSTNCSMTELVRISKNKAFTTKFSRNSSTMLVQQTSWESVQRPLFHQCHKRRTMDK